MNLSLKCLIVLASLFSFSAFGSVVTERQAKIVTSRYEVGYQQCVGNFSVGNYTGGFATVFCTIKRDPNEPKQLMEMFENNITRSYPWVSIDLIKTPHGYLLAVRPKWGKVRDVTVKYFFRDLKLVHSVETYGKHFKNDIEKFAADIGGSVEVMTIE